MRHARSWKNTAVLLAVLAAGCRLPWREGPVSQPLADCRRFSRQGVSAMERGEQRNAESLLSKAVAACPTDAEARRYYAESLWRRGAKTEAIAQMEEAGRLTGEDAALLARLAEMYLAVGQMDRARQYAERAIDIEPKLPLAWTIRGGVNQASGQPRQALADYLRALGYSPRDRVLLARVAETYRLVNEPDRALQTLQSLMETYSPGEEPSQLLDDMGQAYVALGRYDDAIESFSTALTRTNPTSELYCRLGEAELLAGHRDEAAAAAHRALAIDPQHVAGRQLLDRIVR